MLISFLVLKLTKHKKTTMKNETRVIFLVALVSPLILLVLGYCHLTQEDSICSVVDINVYRDPDDISDENQDPMQKWFIEIHARSLLYSDPVDGFFVVTSGKDAFTDEAIDYYNVVGFKRPCVIHGDGLIVPKYVTEFDGIHARGHAQNWAVVAVIAGGLLLGIWVICFAALLKSSQKTTDYEMLIPTDRLDPIAAHVHGNDLYPFTGYKNAYIDQQ